MMMNISRDYYNFFANINKIKKIDKFIFINIFIYKFIYK